MTETEQEKEVARLIIEKLTTRLTKDRRYCAPWEIEIIKLDGTKRIIHTAT